jgi:hypothetical protein
MNMNQACGFYHTCKTAMKPNCDAAVQKILSMVFGVYDHTTKKIQITDLNGNILWADIMYYCSQ